MSIHLREEETELVINHLENAEKEIEAVRKILLGRFEIKKKESVRNGIRSKTGHPDNGAVQLDLDVSEIVFKQKAGVIAEPYAKWGWAFAYTQNREYHDESRELVQAIEQYEKIQVGNRIYTLGGTDGNLLNFKEIDEKKGARANDGSS